MRRGIKIFILDDEIAVIQSIKAFLGDKYYCDGCTGSREGIEKLKKEKFDVLVLDYRIDDLNGEQVVNEVRKFDSDIYIMLLTGHADEVPGLKSLDTFNIQSYCEKSHNIEQAIISIESVVNSIEFFKDRKKTIGQKIRELRKIYNLSQDDLAKHLDVQRTSITLYENGNAIPPTLTIIKLAKLFNVTTDYILCYELSIEQSDIKKNLNR
ncbi:MAG: helix-turn-helix domain-containing protein [Clostridia bacterium]|nr:helix-turn-helix domain-containing protein [Clostridia bacterium]